MYTRFNSGQNKEKIYQNALNNYATETREIRTARYGIPKPVRQKQNEPNFSKTTNYQKQNNYYFINTARQNKIPFIINHNERYKIDNQDNYLKEIYPLPQTERYNFNNRVIVYQKKISGDKTYNNNSVHFIKQKSSNINQNYEEEIDYQNNINNNHTYIISRGNTPNIIQNKGLRPNYSSKNLNAYSYDENVFNGGMFQTINNSKNNYKIVDIKHKSSQNNLNMTTPNNTRIHTIFYTNKKNDKIPTPQRLFANTGKYNNTKIVYSKERNIPKEINEYFAKNKISYTDRSKYINAALLIQTTYRNLKKNGKIKFNFIKKYVKFYRAINGIQTLLNNIIWKYCKDKLFSYKAPKNTYSKRTISRQIYKNKTKNINDNLNNEKNFYSVNNPKPILRSQSRDIVNVEKLIKEKEDLEKRLNQIMEENNMLKKINLSNKELIYKNLELTKKSKKLELENEKYLSEFSKTKDKYSKIENEVLDVNTKLKITYLKFLLEKKDKKRKQILNKYFKKYKENVQRMILLEEKIKNEKNPNFNLVNALSSVVKDKYAKNKEQEKEKEEKIKKRNKLLMDLFYNKDKERTRFIHSCFSKFYYKGLINQYKFRKSVMLDQLRNDNLLKKEEERKREEKRIQEEKIKKEEEERKKKEEEERLRNEEERKKREEEEKKRKEEERKIEEELKKEEDIKYKEQMKKLNKLNMERRKKLRKLLQEEKKQKLDIKREYFKKYHFRVFFFASNLLSKNQENKESNRNKENENEIERRRIEEEEQLKIQKEREELNQKKMSKLQAIFFKKDRILVKAKKNIMQRWNLIAKIISLGPKKKIRGKSKKRGESKKGKKDQKPKKPLPIIPKIEKKNNNQEEDKKSEDENDKEDEKEVKKENEM